MTRLPRGTISRRTVAACVLLAWAGAAAPSAPAQTTASAPSTSAATPEAALDWLEAILSPAGTARERLEQLRISGGPNAAQAATALKEGLDALDSADRKLADPALKAPPLPATRPAPKAEDWERAFRSQARLRRCQVALLRAELYQAAAAACPPGEVARNGYLKKEIETCSSLRVEFRDIPLSILGDIFECRAHRLAGDAKAALATLDPVLKMAPSAEDKQWTEILRLAKLEALETLLVSDRAAAVRDANQWRGSVELRSDPLWQARLDWLLARGRLDDLQARQAKGAAPSGAELQGCAALLRAKGLAGAAPEYDRLEALERLDAIGGGKVMTRQELLAWAELLAGAGRSEAVPAFDRVLAMAGEPLATGQMLDFATALWKQGQWVKTADVCDRILRQIGPADEQAPGVLQARSAALLKASATQPAGGGDAMRKRLLAALRPVFESNLPPPARREALVQWLSLGGDGKPSDVLGVLDRQQELVQGSAYLLYGQATRAYAALQPRLLSAATQPQADLAKQVEAVAAGLRAAQAAAAEANDAPLLARAVLAQAQVRSRPPARDAQGALQLLTRNRPALDADKAVAVDAAWLRVQLMMDLGMVEPALAELAELPREGLAQAAVPLRLAEAVAARFASVDEASRGRLREQVISLCNRAMMQALADPNAYVGLARHCSRALLSAGAGADAERILTPLLDRPAVQADPETDLDCRLMLARALQAQGKSAEAAKRFDEVSARFPKSVVAHVYRGRHQLAMKQPEGAAESFRAARKLAKEGSPDWCEATLDLSAALQAQGQSAAAADVLRVARALHPAFGNDELRARLIEAQKQLGAAAPGVEAAR
jgi:tetratricopeptide (TPR) repeat protein